MNREQRRAEERLARKAQRQMWPSGEVQAPADTGLEEGDKFTIAGMRRLKNGHITRNCKPGTETVWIAKVIAH